jgi:predicted oxidoreductase
MQTQSKNSANLKSDVPDSNSSSTIAQSNKHLFNSKHEMMTVIKQESSDLLLIHHPHSKDHGVHQQNIKQNTLTMY